MDLRRWILEQVDLPSEGRLASDEVVLARYWASTEEERVEFRTVLVRLLVEAGQHNLWRGPWVMRTRHLAKVVCDLELPAAKLPLLYLAQRDLPPTLLNWVLYALAGVQQGPALWDFWWPLWESSDAALWPVIATGLRLCDPQRALQQLPTMVERSHEMPWLGELLWSYASLSNEGFTTAMQSLSVDLQERCQKALISMGAVEDELRLWFAKA